VTSNGHNPTNLILNAGTLGALLIALIVGGFVATDIYDIVHRLETQSQANGDAINTTITKLSNTYNLIIENQKIIIDLANDSNENQRDIVKHFDNLTTKLISVTDMAQNNSGKNLNMTKFNRAALVDSNHILREMAKQLNMTLPPFDPTKPN